MEIYGCITSIGNERQMSENFALRELILDCSTYEQGTGRKFENVLKFQAINSKTQLLEGLQPGQRVKVNFYPNGRFYEKEGEQKHSQNLNLLRIEKI